MQCAFPSLCFSHSAAFSLPTTIAYAWSGPRRTRVPMSLEPCAAFVGRSWRRVTARKCCGGGRPSPQPMRHDTGRLGANKRLLGKRLLNRNTQWRPRNVHVRLRPGRVCSPASRARHGPRERDRARGRRLGGRTPGSTECRAHSPHQWRLLPEQVRASEVLLLAGPVSRAKPFADASWFGLLVTICSHARLGTVTSTISTSSTLSCSHPTL